MSYEARHAHLRPYLEAIVWQHSEYGDRGATVELRETYHQRINRKVVQRLHQVGDLPPPHSTQQPKLGAVHQVIVTAGERANLSVHLEEIGLFEVAYTGLRFADGTARHT